MRFINEDKILDNNSLELYADNSSGYFMPRRYNVFLKKDITKIDTTIRRYFNKQFVVGLNYEQYNFKEEENKLFINALNSIDRRQCGVTIFTTSNLVLRDIELFKKINNHSKVIIIMKISSYKDNINNILFSGQTSYKERINTLKILNENGIKTGLLIEPILPYITDDLDNIKTILDDTINIVDYVLTPNMSLKIKHIFENRLYEILDENFLGLKSKYMDMKDKLYFLKTPNEKRILTYISNRCKESGKEFDMENDNKIIEDYESKFCQLSLF